MIGISLSLLSSLCELDSRIMSSLLGSLTSPTTELLFRFDFSLTIDLEELAEVLIALMCFCYNDG